MSEALRLAERGLGSTWPNPMVGAVLWRKGEIVGRGFHERAGGPHAEVVALREAGPRALGATCYVSLEPCAHHGRTPPCAQALIEAGVRRVVYAVVDPDPRVDGGGIGQLRAAGIEVAGPLLAERSAALNGPFMIARRRGRAAVALKLATTLDGHVADTSGVSRWITSEASRARVHRLRAAAQAVMVGAGTFQADDPRLTPRDVPRPGSSTIRIVVGAGGLELPGRRLLESLPEDPIWLAIPAELATDPRVAAAAALGARVVPLPSEDGRVRLEDLLAFAEEQGVLSIFCEGGAVLASALLQRRLVDRLHLMRAPRLLGADAGRPAILGIGATGLAQAQDWERVAAWTHGPDIEEVLVPAGGVWRHPG